MPVPWALLLGTLKVGAVWSCLSTTFGPDGAAVRVEAVAGLPGGAGPQAYSSAKAAVINLSRRQRSSRRHTACGSTRSARV
ncbi:MULTISPECIES: hypothetical protein [Pseudonocardia]|uniref:Uncharacterized protein n=1 Tax=Pseudonocardia abyssalis TaxID=2792008 RepID=A0ABS6V2V6_9PSEU|nr:hypothetical protein [Pseudonocardia abyssalis]MBW0113678.1 hypothetical protein [Pseudonocardia abyssalis]MBW0138359.1 hypothetical protein [Pseudonocardia abyssalis]